MVKFFINILVVLCVASTVFAAPVKRVEYTPHNFSTDGTSAYRTAELQICIFCHTPHGGDNTADTALWNRDLTDFVGTTYGTYNSSIGLSNLGFAVGRKLNAETLMCLSCHDGTVAVGDVINASNDIGKIVGDPVRNIFDYQGPYIGSRMDYTLDPAEVVAATAGTDLTDDHPVSFSYYDVEQWYVSNSLPGLKTVAQAEAAGIRFYPLDVAEAAGTKRLECSSCHDPHVDYGDAAGSPNAGDPAYEQYKPFLVMSNYNSAMCLACHDK